MANGDTPEDMGTSLWDTELAGQMETYYGPSSKWTLLSAKPPMGRSCSLSRQMGTAKTFEWERVRIRSSRPRARGGSDGAGAPEAGDPCVALLWLE